MKHDVMTSVQSFCIMHQIIIKINPADGVWHILNALISNYLEYKNIHFVV